MLSLFSRAGNIVLTGLLVSRWVRSDYSADVHAIQHEKSKPLGDAVGVSIMIKSKCF